MKKLLTPKRLAYGLLIVAAGIAIWYALREQPKQAKHAATYTFI